MTSRETTPLPAQVSTGLARARPLSGPGLGVYLPIGTYFGIVATKGKELGRRGYRYWIGGTLFGLGWALAGACPGPIFALMGNGVTVYGVVLLSALFGTWLYGVLRPRLPHY